MMIKLFNPVRFATITGIAVGLGHSWNLSRLNVIHNEAYATPTLARDYQQGPARRSRFGGVIDYQQLSVGSFMGLGLGYVVGKLSKVLVALLVAGALTLQFLQSRGIINTSSVGATWGVIKWGGRRVDLKQLINEKPSFKVAFLSSFAIAALYA